MRLIMYCWFCALSLVLNFVGVHSDVKRDPMLNQLQQDVQVHFPIIQKHAAVRIIKVPKIVI